MPDNQDHSAIPEHVRRFVSLNMASVPHLETMLLMSRDASRQWDAQRVARRLYMKEEAAARVLADLRAAGIIAPDGGDAYIYKPVSEELRNVICEVACCYARNLRLVTNLIHSRTAAKARRA